MLRSPGTSLLPTPWPNLELVVEACKWYCLSNSAMRSTAMKNRTEEPLGARIISSTRWQPPEHMLVRLPFKNEPSRARIIYCDVLPTNAFAVGLKFPSAVDDWLVPHDDV